MIFLMVIFIVIIATLKVGFDVKIPDLKNVKTKKPFKSVKINIVKNGKKIEYEVIVEEYQNS